MTAKTIIRNTCDRCGSEWEGWNNPHTGEIIVRTNNKQKHVVGTVHTTECTHTKFHIFGHLCSTCMTSFLDWFEEDLK